MGKSWRQPEDAIAKVFAWFVGGRKGLDRSPSAEQVDDENHQGHDEQQMDQASSNMQAEPQEPQNQKHHEDCPEHVSLLT